MSASGVQVRTFLRDNEANAPARTQLDSRCSTSSSTESERTTYIDLRHAPCRLASSSQAGEQKFENGPVARNIEAASMKALSEDVASLRQQLSEARAQTVELQRRLSTRDEELTRMRALLGNDESWRRLQDASLLRELDTREADYQNKINFLNGKVDELEKRLKLQLQDQHELGHWRREKNGYLARIQEKTAEISEVRRKLSVAQRHLTDLSEQLSRERARHRAEFASKLAAKSVSDPRSEHLTREHEVQSDDESVEPSLPPQPQPVPRPHSDEQASLLQDLRRENEQLGASLEDAQRLSNCVRSDYEAMLRKNAELESTLSYTRTQLNELQKQPQQQQQEPKQRPTQDEREVQRLRARVSALVSDRDELLGALSEFDARLNKFHATLDTVRGQRDELIAKLRSVEPLLTHVSTSSSHSETVSTGSDFVSPSTSGASSETSSTSRSSTDASTASNLLSELRDLRQKLHSLTREHKRLQDELASVKLEKSKLEQVSTRRVNAVERDAHEADLQQQVDHWCGVVETLRAQLKEKEKQLSDESTARQENANGTPQEVTALRRELKRVAEQLKQAEQCISESKGTLAAAVAQQQHLQHLCEEKDNELESLHQQLAESRARLEATAEQLGETQHEREQLTQRVRQLEATMDERVADCDKLVAEVQKTSKQAEVQAAQAKLQAADAAQLGRECERLHAEAAARSARFEQLQKQHDVLVGRETLAQERLRHARTKFEELLSNYKQVCSQHESLRSSCEQLSKQLAEAHGRLQEAQRSESRRDVVIEDLRKTVDARHGDIRLLEEQNLALTRRLDELAAKHAQDSAKMTREERTTADRRLREQHKAFSVQLAEAQRRQQKAHHHFKLQQQKMCNLETIAASRQEELRSAAHKIGEMQQLLEQMRARNARCEAAEAQLMQFREVVDRLAASNASLGEQLAILRQKKLQGMQQEAEQARTDESSGGDNAENELLLSQFVSQVQQLQKQVSKQLETMKWMEQERWHLKQLVRQYELARRIVPTVSDHDIKSHAMHETEESSVHEDKGRGLDEDENEDVFAFTSSDSDVSEDRETVSLPVVMENEFSFSRPKFCVGDYAPSASGESASIRMLASVTSDLTPGAVGSAASASLSVGSHTSSHQQLGPRSRSVN
ncbi:MAG: hypothetical protein MHM6MM_007244 [Cercozoa sp. M6MM]